MISKEHIHLIVERRAFKCLLWVILVLYSGLVPMHAQRHVEILADIETFSYRVGEDLRNGKNPIRNQYSVVCIASTNEWQIEIRSFSEVDRWQFDGTNLVENIIGPKKPHGLTGRANPTTASIVETATTRSNIQEVISGVHIWKTRDGCPLDDSRVNIPWLVFCSGTYLKRDGRIIPFPVVDLRHAPDGFAYSDKTLTFGDSLGLPEKIDLFASDLLFAASVTNGAFEGNRDVELWKRGFRGFKWDLRNGALRFRYAAIESTNFFGWNIPVRFEWFLSFDENSKLIPLGQGKLTSLRDSIRPESPLVPRMPSSIVDWRFQDTNKGVKAIIYTSTNSFILPTNNPDLQVRFAARIKNAKPTRPATRSRKWIIATFVLVSLMVPAAVIFLPKGQKNSTKERQL